MYEVEVWVHKWKVTESIRGRQDCHGVAFVASIALRSEHYRVLRITFQMEREKKGERERKERIERGKLAKRKG